MTLSATIHRSCPWKTTLRSALALGILALGAAVRAVPLDLDFGPLGPSFHDVGAVDAGINIVRFGNVTGTGLPVQSAATFSVPQGLQVDRMTLTILSYTSSKGALLRVNLLAPNAGEVQTFQSESDFVGLSIKDPSAVTASFGVTPHPDFGGTVDAYWALRIDASEVTAPVPEPAAAALWATGLAVTAPVPEPAAAALWATGLAALLVARRRRPRQA